VRLGFKTDTSVIPDPERILDAFHEEIDELHRDLTLV
jgi:diacylglycerol O-acyltransferase / wax synthase